MLFSYLRVGWEPVNRSAFPQQPPVGRARQSPSTRVNSANQALPPPANLHLNTNVGKQRATTPSSCRLYPGRGGNTSEPATAPIDQYNATRRTIDSPLISIKTPHINDLILSLYRRRHRDRKRSGQGPLGGERLSRSDPAWKRSEKLNPGHRLRNRRLKLLNVRSCGVDTRMEWIFTPIASSCTNLQTGQRYSCQNALNSEK